MKASSHVKFIAHDTLHSAYCFKAALHKIRILLQQSRPDSNLKQTGAK